MELNPVPALLPSPLTPATDTEGLAEANAAADVNFDSFLTLLTAQLENQDPLQPLESTEFVAQLATFSSVEQLITANEQIEALASQTLNSAIATFSQWIGREVAVTDGTFRANGEAVRFPLPEDAGARTIEAEVKTEAGSVLRSFPVSADEDGVAQWDGLDQAGRPVTSQDLVIELNFVEDGEVTDTVPAEVLRTVEGIQGSDEGPRVLLSDGRTITLDQVSRLNAARVPESG